MNIRRGSSPLLHRWTAQWQTPPESGFELRPALQRADQLSHAAPQSEPHRTPSEPRRTPLEKIEQIFISVKRICTEKTGR